MKNVQAVTKDGLDLTDYIIVDGHVDYGKIGVYTLTYSLNIQGVTASATRSVTINNNPISRPGRTKNYSSSTITLGSGSYLTGDGSQLENAPINPAFVDNELLNKPLPTNGWWNSLIGENYGRQSGLFLNPLRSSFSKDGVEITDTGSGFTQYWRDDAGALTVATFALPMKDLVLKANALSNEYITKVIDYSDNAVKVAMRNSHDGADEMVTTLVQGSPFIFTEFNQGNGYFHLNQSGTHPYEFYSITGEKQTDSYTGSSLIIKLPNVHVGYVCTVPNGPGTNVTNPLYQDKYYLVSAPNNTTFTFSRDTHANEAFKDKVSFVSDQGNYISICSLDNMQEASYYQQYAYSFIHKANTSYEVDHDRSIVKTTFSDNYSNIKSPSSGVLLGLLPHQYLHSDATLTNRKIDSVRGDVKLIESSVFTTEQSYYGMLPTYTLPTNREFSSETALSYLESLDNNTNNTYGDTDDERKGPYWDAKTFYPLAQGVIFADQLNNDLYKEKFLTKLEAILVNWFTYSGPTDEDYIYYNQKWGTMYYSNNEFNTSSELSDHHFTHGYLVYAASVASMYDKTFYNNYGSMIEALLLDYMNYDSESETYPELRSFDPWAGHSWAHGYGFFAEGNNQESSGEALNSWVAGYLFGLQLGDEELVDAAIYGFTTELNAIKEYVFNYHDLAFTKEYTDVVNISSIIWGGKNTYATWFGLHPSFIYGIHYLPIGEYVSAYAVGSEETQIVREIYADYRRMMNGFNETWMANMWSVQALFDPSAALSNFNANAILNDDYPNDLISAYWNINAAKTLGTRSNEVFATNSNKVASDVYKASDGSYAAQLWNSSNESQVVNFVDNNGRVVGSYTVPANSFVKVAI